MIKFLLRNTHAEKRDQADAFLTEKGRDLIGRDMVLPVNDMVHALLEDFSKNQETGIRAWGHIVNLLGARLHRTQNLHKLLDLVEIAFNSNLSSIRKSAFKAWRRLILSFLIKGMMFK